jgi:3-hydroxyisobutyrate dehydrogenase-like beta-hydroxyacid dehydrogenase
MRLAFLGLGIMGRAMAVNLVKAGHEVTAWNRTPRPEIPGARMVASPADASANAEVVWVCVSDTAAVEQVLFGTEGVFKTISPASVVVDSSTIAPSATQRFATKMHEKQVEFVDAPVTGSKIGAENGTLIFIAGGRESIVKRLEPLFKAMGKQVIRMGEVGQGQAAKLAMNLQIALIYEGFAEALTLARKLGVDQRAFFDLIQASMVRSGVMDYKIPFVEKRDFSPNFPLRLMHKDIRIMLDTAKQAGVKLPALETVEQIYARAHANGRDDLDYAVTLLEVAGDQDALCEAPSATETSTCNN